MEQIWNDMYKAAKAVQNGRKISDYIDAGGVAAAILSTSGKIYTGVCIDAACTLGICAERSAIFNMITNGEHEIEKVLAVMSNGKIGAPCGACRELMSQLMPNNYRNIEILLDYGTERIVTLGELTRNGGYSFLFNFQNGHKNRSAFAERFLLFYYYSGCT